MNWLLVLCPLLFALGFLTASVFYAGKLADLYLQIDMLEMTIRSGR